MWLNARLGFVVLLLACIILLVAPIVLRDKFSNGMLINEDSYKNLRLANEIKEKGSLEYDELSYGGRPYIGEKAWIFLLSINPRFMINYLPLIFGVFTFIIFYFLIDKFKPNIRGLASLLLITSPPFLYLFSSATKYAAALFFILLGFYFINMDKKIYAYLSFVLGGLFSVFTVFLVVLIFFYNALKKKEFKDFLILFLCSILLFLLYFSKIFSLGLPEVILGFEEFSFSKLSSFIIFGLGSEYGMGFFFLILSLIGIYSSYKEKYKFLLLYILLFLFLVSSFYTRFLLLYINFILAFFAALGFMAFIAHEWKSNVLKFLTILVVCCGLVFSLLVFYDRTKDLYPSSDYYDAVEFLKSQGEGVVFSYYINGKIINYADKSNFLDTDFAYAPNLIERWGDMQIFLKTKDVNATEDFILKYNIKYILIDKEMKKKLFTNDEDGLLFVLKYSPHKFFMVFKNDEVEIWSMKNNIITKGL